MNGEENCINNIGDCNRKYIEEFDQFDD